MIDLLSKSGIVEDRFTVCTWSCWLSTCALSHIICSYSSARWLLILDIVGTMPKVVNWLLCICLILVINIITILSVYFVLKPLFSPNAPRSV